VNVRSFATNLPNLCKCRATSRKCDGKWASIDSSSIKPFTGPCPVTDQHAHHLEFLRVNSPVLFSDPAEFCSLIGKQQLKPITVLEPVDSSIPGEVLQFLGTGGYMIPIN
jgi:hypothetical protein